MVRGKRKKEKGSKRERERKSTAELQDMEKSYP